VNDAENEHLWMVLLGVVPSFLNKFTP
jgi:hypothetical protein